MCKNDHKEKIKGIKNVVEKIMIVIHIFFKIFCITGNAERLWLLEWLIAAVNMVFYLFKQSFTSMFCRLLQAYINNIVSFNLFKHTYKSKNVIVLSNNQL